MSQYIWGFLGCVGDLNSDYWVIKRLNSTKIENRTVIYAKIILKPLLARLCLPNPQEYITFHNPNAFLMIMHCDCLS